MNRHVCRQGVLLAALLCALPLPAANIGRVQEILGQVTDLVYDSQRQLVYLANFTGNRVEVYSVGGQRLLEGFNVGTSPASLAISPDKQTLYIANSLTPGSITLLDLNSGAVRDEIPVGARPDAIAVGADGQVLVIAGTAAGQTVTAGLLRVDPATRTVTAVPIAPPPSTINPTPGATPAGFRASLAATPSGQLIFGLSNNRLFVYEVASGLVLRSRNVGGLNAVVAAAPDGTKFMVGPYLFDASDLTILGRGGTFGNAQTPLAGGAAFSLDGNTLYTSFNTQTPLYPENRNQPDLPALAGTNPRPGTVPALGVLQVRKASNTAPTLGLRLPDRVIGRMILSDDGQNLFAIANSGLLAVPIGRLNQFPVITAERQTVLLSVDICNRNPQTFNVRITNAGGGRLTYSALASTPGGLPTQPPVANNLVIINQATGVAPGNLQLTFDPRNRTLTRGTTQAVIQIVAPDAVNIEPTIMVNLNFRDVDQIGEMFPLPAIPTDMLLDAARQRIYLASQSLGRIDVFSLASRSFLPPVDVGAEPRSMTLVGTNLLAVALNASEHISLVDLDSLQQVDLIPLGPLSLTATPLTPNSIAATTNAILFTTIQLPAAAPAAGVPAQPGPGQLWQLSLATRSAFPRPNLGLLNNMVQPNNVNSVDPRTVLAAPADGSAILMVSTATGAGINATLRLYDPVSDSIPVVRQVSLGGALRGAVSAAGDGSYFVVDQTVFNRSLALLGTIQGQAGTFTQSLAAANAQALFRVRTAVGTGPQPDTRMRLERMPLSNLTATQSIPLVESVIISPTAPRGQIQLLPRAMTVDSPTGNSYLLTQTGLAIVPLALGAGRPPAFASNQVVNGASFRGPVAPGAIITIFGTELGVEASAESLPLPTVLGGSCVTVADTPIPLFYTSAGQINAQVPPTIASGNVSFSVRSLNTGRVSAGVNVPVAATSPAIFTVTDHTGRRMAAVFRIDAAGAVSLVTPDNKAFRDERVMVFATGLGATFPPVAAGQPAPASGLARTNPFQVCVGGHPYPVEFSGLAPGYVGLYQLNLYVPGDRVQGDRLPIVITPGSVDCRNASTTGAPVTSIR